MRQVKNKDMLHKYYYWQRSGATTELWGCYKAPSAAKRYAFENCKRVCKQYNGRNLRIIGHNCQTFSAGFIGLWNNQKAFFYISPYRNDVMLISDIEKKHLENRQIY